jgi:aminopeptidase YwaD
MLRNRVESAQRAIDNASGLVVALAVARDLAASVKNQRRGLRLAMFNVEEWALTGSSHYVGELSPRQRDSIALIANLDSVGIDAKLTALTSGFPGIKSFLLSQSEQSGVPLGLYRPLQ